MSTTLTNGERRELTLAFMDRVWRFRGRALTLACQIERVDPEASRLLREGVNASFERMCHLREEQKRGAR